MVEVEEETTLFYFLAETTNKVEYKYRLIFCKMLFFWTQNLNNN